VHQEDAAHNDMHQEGAPHKDGEDNKRQRNMKREGAARGGPHQQGNTKERDTKHSYDATVTGRASP